MNNTQTDVFQELLNEVRGLRETVEPGEDADRPLTLKEAAAYLWLYEDTVARWARHVPHMPFLSGASQTALIRYGAPSTANPTPLEMEFQYSREPLYDHKKKEPAAFVRCRLRVCMSIVLG